MQHFNKLRTPLRSVHQYPQLQDQERRFLNREWASVVARSLWDLWSDDNFLPMEQRVALNAVEPFDEWEEFALFASHYFLLVASNSPKLPKVAAGTEYIGAPSSLPSRLCICSNKDPSTTFTLRYCNLSKQQVKRRFGALYPAHLGVLHHHGGLGTQTRLNSTDVYFHGDTTPISGGLSLPPSAIGARMCHTVTSIDETSSLLVGGRVSPDRALSDCWIVRSGSWEKVEDLPLGLYRHSATKVELTDRQQGVLVYGGKTSGGVIVNLWLLWRDSTGWVEVSQSSNTLLRPRFGAAMTSVGANQGILLGGMAEDGTIIAEMWQWFIEDKISEVAIYLQNRSFDLGDPHGLGNVICRFGACFCWTSIGLLLVGGLSAHILLPREFDILGLAICQSQTQGPGALQLRPFKVNYEAEGPRLLFAGHATYSDLGNVAIVGGGAVCFSFGTHWNEGIWTLRWGNDKANQTWQPLGASTQIVTTEDEKSYMHGNKISADQQSNPSAVPRICVKTKKDFEKILSKSQPVIMERLEIGRCTQTWTLDYLKTKVGGDRPVSLPSSFALMSKD